MKITQLDIQGFRSLKNVSWRPGDLNVIIGPNGSGKSNLLRMLELVSSSSNQKLDAYFQNAGGINSVVWDGQAGMIRLNLDMTSPDVGYEVAIKTYKGSNYYFIDKEIVMDTEKEVAQLKRLGQDAVLVDLDENTVRQISQRVMSDKETVLNVAIDPFDLVDPFSSDANIVNLQAWAEGIALYQDIRTDQNALIRQAPVSRLEQRVAPDGQNLINVLHTLYTGDRKFKQDVNDAMHAAFGEDFDELIFPPAADQRIQMRVRWKTLKREQSTADLSDGTLRFLFLIAVLATPSPPPLIAIDEPETGLHPSMLPIIAELAVEAATRTQVVFTTHSDQFLDAFHGTRPTTTVAKWENGETTLTTLDDAALDYWLQDYSLGRLFRSGELENLAA